MGIGGRSQVTRGTTTAVTPIFLLDDRVAETSNVVIDWTGDLWDIPPMPEILAFRLERGRHRLRARRSDTNEADDALSRMALASTDDPSGALTITRQVMSSEFDFNPMAAFETTGVSELSVGREDGVAAGLSMCRAVWWGFWHFLHL